MPRNVAMAILEQLAAWGVRKVYGYIGDDLFYLFDALARQKDVQFYQVRHEETAAFMASAQAKLTGMPAVCIADGGPGTLHLLNGLADAFAERVPVLAITGQVARRDIGTNAKQYIDQQSLFRPLASYTALLCDPAATADIMEKAYCSAVAGRSVAHISVPMDVLPLPCAAPTVPPPPYLNTPPSSAEAVIDGALAIMEKANRPVILVGEGGRRAGAAVAELSARWGAAVLNTLPGTGVVDSTLPWYVGGLGHAGTPAAAALLKAADTCLVVGANWWPQQHVPANIPVIQVALHPADIGATTPVTFGVAGDAGQVLRQMLGKIKVSPNLEWVKRIERELHRWLEQLERETGDQGVPVHPAAVIKALQDTVESNAVICIDTGDHTVWFGRVFRPHRQRVLVSGKWRSMGFALPAALAAKINRPHRQVLALVGDGGLGMNMQEFLTAVQYNLQVTVVVINNGSLAMEKNKMLAGGLLPEGTTLHNPDFAQFARCCGGRGYTVEQPGELREVLRQALGCGSPAIVDITASGIAVPGTTMP